MKQLLVLLLAAMASCTSQQTPKQPEDNGVHDKHTATETVPLNNGIKWKADEATKKNVAAMVQVVNDSILHTASKRQQLAASIQSQLDTLIKQCRMKGAEHDALHVWLEKVLHDTKTMKEGKADYGESFVTLKSGIERFYETFE